jgi:hypothetical protein
MFAMPSVLVSVFDADPDKPVAARLLAHTSSLAGRSTLDPASITPIRAIGR